MAKIKIDLLEDFEGFDDPRIDRTKEHPLEVILFIAICAVLSGAEGYVGMAVWGCENLSWLKRYIEITSIPSHDTFRRVLGLIDPIAFEQCFVKWVNRLLKGFGSTKLLAIDGKTLRGSRDGEKNGAHIVSAYASEIGLVLGQVKVDDKSNEITAIPELLDCLDIKGKRVTIDAMGCQKEIARKIVEKKGEYCLAVKDNQPTLHANIKALFEEIQKKQAIKGLKSDFKETTDKGHGRVELRKHCVLHVKGVYKNTGWPKLGFVARIESTRTLKGKTSEEVRYFIGSGNITAENLAITVRSHWGIENKLHWCLDVGFNEDHCRIRKDHGPRNFATLRKIALNLFRQDTRKEGGIKIKRLRSASNAAYREWLLGLAPQPWQ